MEVLLVSNSPQLIDETRKALDGEHLVIRQGNVHSIEKEKGSIRADYILWIEQSGEDHLPQLARLCTEYPEIPVFYLLEKRNSLQARNAYRAGVYDVFFIPEEFSCLRDVIKREWQKTHARRREDGKRGKVIAIYSGKGGSGRTLLSCTLAQTLALDHDRYTLLCDLNLQSGAFPYFLEMEPPEKGLAELTNVLGELQEYQLKMITATEPYSQIDVLFAPRRLSDVQKITETHVQAVIRVARRVYDFLLLDLPNAFNPLSYTALCEADEILYVMEPNLLSFSVFQQVRAYCQELGFPMEERFKLVLNRWNRYRQFTPKELEEYCAVSVLGMIPDDPKWQNDALPPRKRSGERRISMMARGVRELSKQLLRGMFDA